ncbi:phage terminase small subunit-related protein [Paenibacillus sp. MAH-36]
MPRERSPDRDKAKQIWLESNGKLKPGPCCRARTRGNSDTEMEEPG